VKGSGAAPKLKIFKYRGIAMGFCLAVATLGLYNDQDEILARMSTRRMHCCMSTFGLDRRRGMGTGAPKVHKSKFRQNRGFRQLFATQNEPFPPAFYPPVTYLLH